MSDTTQESLTNAHGTLCFHRQSLRGVVQDYIISFHEEECDIERILSKTYDLFESLIQKYSDKHIKARLVAQVICAWMIHIRFWDMRIIISHPIP